MLNLDKSLSRSPSVRLHVAYRKASFSMAGNLSFTIFMPVGVSFALYFCQYLLHFTENVLPESTLSMDCFCSPTS